MYTLQCIDPTKNIIIKNNKMALNPNRFLTERVSLSAKKLTYFYLLPTELLNLLLLYVSLKDVILFLADIEPFRSRSNNNEFLVTLWKNKISTIVPPTGQIFKKIETIVEFEKIFISNTDMIKWLAERGFNKRLFNVIGDRKYLNVIFLGAVGGRQKELMAEIFSKAGDIYLDFGQALRIAKLRQYNDIIDILKDELRKINSNSIYLTMY